MDHWLSAVFAIVNSKSLPDLELSSGSLELLCELVVNTLLYVNPGTSTTGLTVVEADISIEYDTDQITLTRYPDKRMRRHCRYRHHQR